MTTNLLGLKVENFKALTLFEAQFDPSGGVVSIVGKNGAGKTSALDALESLLAGRKAPAVSQPVHAGAMEARAIATFDDLVVERVWKNGSTAISVKGAGKGAGMTPDEVLRKLYTTVGFDPFAFSKMTDKEQVDLLLPLIGVDPAPYDQEYEEAFSERTDAKRALDSLQARLEAAAEAPPGTPDEEVSAAELMRKHTLLLENNRRDEALTRDLDAARTRLAQLEQELHEARKLVTLREASVAEQTAAVVAADAALAKSTPQDATPLEEEIANVDQVNAAVRAKAARATLARETDAAQMRWALLDQRVKRVKVDKADALAKASMPVPHLAIDPDGMTLTLNGTAFRDASSGVKLRTGFVIAMVLNPQLKLVVIRDASLLDDDNRAVIGKLAADNHMLVLMEVSGDGSNVDGAAIVISDGTITETRTA